MDRFFKRRPAEAFYKGLGFQYISTENIFYEVVGHRNFKMYEYILRV